MTSWASVAQLREYLPQVPEFGRQLITITGAPTGGTFTLSYEGTASAALAYNATATAVQTALRAVTGIGAAGVNVKGRPGSPWTADFLGTLATDAAPLTLGTNSLSGGTSPSVTVAPATDALLQNCLDRATDIVRNAMRALLGDQTFDYAAYGSASTKIVQGYTGDYLSLPAHQAGSVTLVEYQSGTNPATYATLPVDQWGEEADGRLYRSSTWLAAVWQRYRVTAIWGYGPVPDAIEELAIELAVNIWRSRDKGGFTEVVGVEGSGGIRAIAGLNKQQVMILENIRDQLYQVAV
jgi:hypothetical protein